MIRVVLVQLAQNKPPGFIVPPGNQLFDLLNPLLGETNVNWASGFAWFRHLSFHIVNLVLVE